VLPPTRYPIRIALKRWVIVPYLDNRTDGFATGNVWTFGFPDSEGSGMGDGNPFGPGGFDGGPGSASGPASGDDPAGDGQSTAGQQAGGEEEYVDVDFERVSDDDESTRES